jgi:hypothetical protein
VAKLVLALLVVLWAGQAAFAGPPEGPSGRMVLDPVADGLRRYRRENDEGRRRALLWKLAPTRDPRVAVALGEVLASCGFPFPEVALLAEFYLPAEKAGSTDAVWDWWREHEAGLRRRARELP